VIVGEAGVAQRDDATNRIVAALRFGDPEVSGFAEARLEQRVARKPLTTTKNDVIEVGRAFYYMAYFQTKNSNLGNFWRDKQWKMLVYFVSILVYFRSFC
jgi:hypothetical protein